MESLQSALSATKTSSKPTSNRPKPPIFLTLHITTKFPNCQALQDGNNKNRSGVKRRWLENHGEVIDKQSPQEDSRFDSLFDLTYHYLLILALFVSEF